MKLSIIFIILIYQIGYSQNYKERYKADICQCLEAENANAKSIEKVYNQCFKKNMTKYAFAIDSKIQEDNKTQKYVKGQKARQELQQNFKYELVYSCDYYFNTLNNARQLILQRLREIPLDSTELDKRNQDVAMKPHWQNYFARASVHFKLGNLKKAEQDLLESLEINPYGKSPIYVRKEMLLLAWVLEEQNRYKEALAIYDEIIIAKIDPDIEILKALVAKRKGGRYINHRSKTSKKPENDLKTISTSKKSKPQEKEISTRRKANKTKDSSDSLRKLFKLN